MKNEIMELVDKLFHDGSQRDLQALKHVLEGLNNKPFIYMDEILHMEGEVKDNTCEVTMPLNPLVNNPLDIVHGGVTATLIDAAMGRLIHTILPPELAGVTTQLNVQYIAPGIGESITCKARIDHQGGKTMLLSADVFRSDGQKIAQATGSFFIIKKRK